MENYPTDKDLFEAGVAWLYQYARFRDDAKDDRRVKYNAAWLKVIRRGQLLDPEEVRITLDSFPPRGIIADLTAILLSGEHQSARDWEIDEAISFFTQPL